jgi:hypothetical protein
MNPVTVTAAEIKFMVYMKTTSEIACVGAGLGGGFDHTSELHVMKYADAMRTPHVKDWSKAVHEEYKRMEDNEVWIPVSKTNVPADAKIWLSTWAMKKKATGTFRARLNGRGFEQVPGIHYDPKSTAAPVVCMMTIRIVFILMLMAEWPGHVLDVRGAFLKGNFADDEPM